MPTTRRHVLALSAAAIAGAAMPTLGAAAPRSSLISGPWQSFGSGSGPDHGARQGFLDRNLRKGEDGIHRVRYAAAEAAGDRPRDYVAMLEGVDPTSLSRDAAYAYWINLYNAQTVDMVIDDWPVGSIKEVEGGLFNTGPWTDKVVTVAGQPLSLDDIEHGILRPVWKDPLIHYGVNCAALGCPNLDPRAYTASTVNAQLRANGKAFVNHPRGISVNDGRVRASSIYEWFQEDFGGTEAGVLRHASDLAGASLRQDLTGKSNIASFDYDWSINAAA